MIFYLQAGADSGGVGGGADGETPPLLKCLKFASTRATARGETKIPEALLLLNFPPSDLKETNYLFVSNAIIRPKIQLMFCS